MFESSFFLYSSPCYLKEKSFLFSLPSISCTCHKICPPEGLIVPTVSYFFLQCSSSLAFYVPCVLISVSVSLPHRCLFCLFTSRSTIPAVATFRQKCPTLTTSPSSTTSVRSTLPVASYPRPACCKVITVSLVVHLVSLVHCSRPTYVT